MIDFEGLIRAKPCRLQMVHAFLALVQTRTFHRWTNTRCWPRKNTCGWISSKTKTTQSYESILTYHRKYITWNSNGLFSELFLDSPIVRRSWNTQRIHAIILTNILIHLRIPTLSRKNESNRNCISLSYSCPHQIVLAVLYTLETRISSDAHFKSQKVDWVCPAHIHPKPNDASSRANLSGHWKTIASTILMCKISLRTSRGVEWLLNNRSGPAIRPDCWHIVGLA